MNPDTDDRWGSRDVDAARLFAAARAFRPSARARRRTLRALGLPVGLSLVGSGLAHAAHLITGSLKAWGMVAGVLGAVGAAGGVAYVATGTTPSRSHRVGDQLLRSKRATVRTEAHVSVRGASEPPGARVRTADAAPDLVTGVPSAARDLEGTGASGHQTRSADEIRLPSKALRRAPTRPRSPSPPSDGPAAEGSPAPEASLREGRPERSIDLIAAGGTASVVRDVSPRDTMPPAFRPMATAAPASSPLRGELAIVAEAQGLLRAGDATAARAVLDRHARVYPAGVLAEEVEVLRLRAFVAEGDTRSARVAGETFLRRHPGSPFVARVRSLLIDLDPRTTEAVPSTLQTSP